jgi:hypothetical protein
MPPSKYLIRALTQPTKVDEQLWEKWYAEEHLPEAVNAGVGDRGGLFRAYDDFVLKAKTPSNPGETTVNGAKFAHFNEPPNDKTFCAMYHTKFEDYTQTEEAKMISTTSDYFDGQSFFPLAEFDVRVYELIQDYNPDGLGDSRYCVYCSRNECLLIM